MISIADEQRRGGHNSTYEEYGPGHESFSLNCDTFAILIGFLKID